LFHYPGNACPIFRRGEIVEKKEGGPEKKKLGGREGKNLKMIKTCHAYGPGGWHTDGKKKIVRRGGYLDAKHIDVANGSTVKIVNKRKKTPGGEGAYRSRKKKKCIMKR